MLVPYRHKAVDEGYRYGFQGQERDDELKGEGNSLNYTFRMHDPRVGRFFAIDPLTASYPHYTPYSFSGNKVIRYVELEGLEEKDPSIFTKAMNAVAGDFYRNRMNDYITKHDIPEENVVELPNDTYVVTRVMENSIIKYSIFRKIRRDDKIFSPLLTSSSHDDIELSENEFNKAEVLGNFILDAPGFGAASTTAKVVMNGTKFTFGQVVGAVNDVRIGIVAWKNEIKVGNLIANSGSKDLLKKGLHFHFKKLGGLELGLTAENGILKLKWLNIGKADDITKAVETFNKSMKNPQFKAVLNANVKAAQETIQDSLKFLKGSDLENANKVLKELEEVSKVLNKTD